MALNEGIDVSTIDISDLPDDPAKLAEQLQIGADSEKEPEKPAEAKPEAKPAEEPKKDDPDPARAGKDDEGPGDVRKALAEARHKEREARREATANVERIKALESEKAELEAKIKAAGAKPDAEVEVEAPKTEDESETLKLIAAIEDDAPQLAAVMKAQVEGRKADRAQITTLAETVKSLNEQLSGVVTRERTEEEDAKRVAQSEVDKAIQGNPTLSYLHDMADSNERAKDLWVQAGQIDTVLKGQARWQGKPFAERFAKVVEMLEVDNGKIELPPEYLTKEQLEAQAKRKSEEAKGKGGQRPSTLSDLPGGLPPAQDQLGAIEDADPLSLLNSLNQAGDVDKGITDLLGKFG